MNHSRAKYILVNRFELLKKDALISKELQRMTSKKIQMMTQNIYVYYFMENMK